MSEHTSPSDETAAADQADAAAAHEPDRMPTPEEEEIADSLELDPKVAEAYKDQAERGAQQKGEGRI